MQIALATLATAGIALVAILFPLTHGRLPGGDVLLGLLLLAAFSLWVRVALTLTLDNPPRQRAAVAIPPARRLRRPKR